MSHTIEYYQRMNTEQLIHEMNHAFWTVDRNRARQVYLDRVRTQAAQDQARSNQQTTALNNNINNLQTRLTDLSRRNDDMARIIRQQNAALQNEQSAHNRQVQEMRTEYNRRIREVNDQNRAAFNNLETQMVNERTEYNRRIREVNDQNRAALNNLEAQMVNEDAKLRATINANWQRTSRMISDLDATMTNRINTIHTDLTNQLNAQQNQINDLDTKFQALHHNDQQLRENAQEYLDAAVALINSTIEYNNTNRHNWRSNDLDQLINMRGHVQTDLNSGMLAVGVARSQARDLFEAALRYRANVHADEREWQLRHSTAQQCVDAANNDLEISRIIEADGMEIDVDYWTCGDLRRIEAQLNSLEMLLENPNLTHDELASIGELAETYRQEISASVTFAMQAVQCSRDRKELLEIAVDHIEETMGILHPVWQEYFAGDNRLGYRVYLTSPQTGERVVLTAEPSKDQTDLRNQFRFEILSTGSAVHNAQDAMNFTNALAQALSEVEGCVFTAPSCTNQAAPAADRGQGDSMLWSDPRNRTQAAMEAAKPSPAPHATQPNPVPSNTFTPQPTI